jgi:hypothetical protein
MHTPRRLGHQRLVVLFVWGGLLLNFPLLALWDGQAYVWGLPLFPLALFAIWAVLIAGVAWVVERMEDEPCDSA